MTNTVRNAVRQLKPGETWANGEYRYTRSGDGLKVGVSKFGYADKEADERSWYWVRSFDFSDLEDDEDDD